MRAGLAPFHGWGTKGTLRYYAGATPADAISGMYSFVPCQPAGGTSGFARPTIELDGFVQPNLRMEARSSEPLNLEQVAGLWREVVGQVVNHGLALATRLELPAS